MDGKYYITWCNGYHGPTIGVAWTEDFKTFHQLENAFLPFNRNGVLLPPENRRYVYDDVPPQRQPATRPLATFTSASPRIWNSGAVTAT